DTLMSAQSVESFLITGQTLLRYVAPSSYLIATSTVVILTAPLTLRSERFPKTIQTAKTTSPTVIIGDNDDNKDNQTVPGISATSVDVVWDFWNSSMRRFW